MSIFQKKFVTLLEQEGPAIEAPVAPELGSGDELDDTMDLAADPAMSSPDNPAINYKKEEHAQQTSTLKGWLSKITEFTKFMNSIEPSSMQAQLNKAECDTVFHAVARSDSTQIARIAKDLSGLEQSLNKHILSSDAE